VRNFGFLGLIKKAHPRIFVAISKGAVLWDALNGGREKPGLNSRSDLASNISGMLKGGGKRKEDFVWNLPATTHLGKGKKGGSTTFVKKLGTALLLDGGTERKRGESVQGTIISRKRAAKALEEGVCGCG